MYHFVIILKLCTFAYRVYLGLYIFVLYTTVKKTFCCNNTDQTFFEIGTWLTNLNLEVFKGTALRYNFDVNKF
jgi:hypothetical protein